MKLRLAFFFLLFASASYAQTATIGLRGGFNIASELWSSPNFNDYQASISSRTLTLFGMEYDHWVSRSFAWGIQFLYDQKGAHDIVNDGSGLSIDDIVTTPSNYSEVADWTLTYFEIPLFVKWRFATGVVRPYFFGGPSIGLLLSNIEHVYGLNTGYGFTEQPTYQGTDTTANISHYTAPIDLSFVGGIGISFILPAGQELFFDAALAFGATNTDHYSGNSQGVSIYSRDVRLAAGIMFPIH